MIALIKFCHTKLICTTRYNYTNAEMLSRVFFSSSIPPLALVVNTYFRRKFVELDWTPVLMGSSEGRGYWPKACVNGCCAKISPTVVLFKLVAT